MRAPALTLSALAMIAGGCAAAMPGYVPSTPQRERMLAAQPKGGGFDAQGVYHLTDQEQKLECKQITGSMAIKILQMREAGKRQAASLPASLAQKGLRPLKGTTAHGLDLEGEYGRDRSRLETFNRVLAEKSCNTFDLEAELKPGNTAPPSPVGGAKAKPKPKEKAAG